MTRDEFVKKWCPIRNRSGHDPILNFMVDLDSVIGLSPRDRYRSDERKKFSSSMDERVKIEKSLTFRKSVV